MEFGTVDQAGTYSTFTVAIHEDSSSSPGTLVGTLTVPSISTGSDQTISFAASGDGLDLAPNTRYWIVFDVTAAGIGSGSEGLSLVAVNSEDAGAASSWEIGNGSLYRNWNASSWNTDSNSLQIQINGTANPAATLSITAPADAAEGDADTRDLSFTVSLSEPVSVTVAYQVCFSGTATADLTGAATIPAAADYQPRFVDSSNNPSASACVTGGNVQAGQVTSKHVGIRVKGDTEGEFDESVIATLSFAGTTRPGVELGTSEATHWIRDDDGAALTLRYGASRANAPEGSTTGYGEFYLRPFNRALGSGETVTVPLSFTGGTLGTDFTLSVDPNHGFASAVLSGSTVTITGPGPREELLKLRVVAPDDTDMTDETVTLGVGAATSTVGTVRPDKQGNAQVTLYDDDVSQSLTVEFARSAFTVDEPDDPSEPVVRLSEVPRSDIAIPVTVSDGTALRGEDYESAATRTVSFPAGRAASRTFDITIIDDAEYEPVDETLTIAIDTSSLPAGVTAKAGGNLQATVTIVSEDPEADPISDSDFLVLGTFEELQYEEHDRRGPDFAVHRLRKANNGNIPNAWGFRLCFAGTATWGADYRVKARNGRVLSLDAGGCTARNSAAYGTAVPAGSDRSWFSVEPIDDAHEDSGETIVISVSKPYNTSMFSYGKDSLTFVILNHEIVEHSKAVPAVQVSSGTGGTEGEAVQFTLQAVPAPASPLAGTLTVSQEGDYVAAGELGSRTVTVPVSGSVTVSVPTVDDDADELAGTVTAALGAGSGYTLGATSSLAVEVADNDETAAPSPTVSECVPDELVATAKRLYERNRHKPPHHAENHFSVLVAFGERTPEEWTADGRTVTPMTAASARQRGWRRFAAALECLEKPAENAAVPSVTLSAPAGDVPEATGRKTLTVALGRTLAKGEALRVPLLFGGAAALGSDYMLAPQSPAPSGVTYANLAGPGAPALTFTGSSASSATLTLTATADGVDEGSGETVTVGLGMLSAAGFHGAVEGKGAVSFTILEPLAVSITAKSASITKGGDAVFTVTASRVAKSDLTVKLTVLESDGSDFVAAASEGAASVTIPKGETEAAFTVATVDDRLDEPDGMVMVRLAGNGGGYTVAASPGDVASVKVADDDAAPAGPMLSISDETVNESDQLMYFTVRLSAKSEEPVSVSYRMRHSTPVSARENVDYLGNNWRLTFQPDETEKRFLIYVFNDSHDEGPETFEVVLYDPSAGVGIADGVAVGTIVNDDPLPAAWLSRFGRTVSHQVVEGVRERFTAPPSASGLHLTLAGEDLTSAVPLAENQQVLAKVLGFESVTAQQVVEGSSFSFSPEGAPAQFALWGQGALSSFSGAEDSVSLDGEVTTALVGAEWSTARWQAGAALSHSWGSGDYEGEGHHREGEEGHPGHPGGDGRISSSLSGIFPYGRYALTPRLGVWGVAGAGRGQLSLKPDGDGREYQPDISLGMAAVGIDGLLLDGGPAGLRLTTTTDLLTVSTTSEAVQGLKSSDGNVSRLRLGLEAARPFPLSSGASLLPSLEVGIRQDSGDAETGFGLELGTGLSWHDARRGIRAEMRGRSLLSHADEEFREQGLAVSLAWDPTPSRRGPSLSLSHAVGATAAGGMDALLHPVVLEGLAAPSSEGQQQFETRFAYGFPIFSDQLTLSPALELALSPTSRTYSLLWTVAPHAPQPGQAAPWHLSLEGERQEHAAASPTQHSLGLLFSLLF